MARLGRLVLTEFFRVAKVSSSLWIPNEVKGLITILPHRLSSALMTDGESGYERPHRSKKEGPALLDDLRVLMPNFPMVAEMCRVRIRAVRNLHGEVAIF